MAVRNPNWSFAPVAPSGSQWPRTWPTGSAAADLPLFRPDIFQVGADLVSVIRCCRLLLPAVGRCCCCHRCCQPRWRGGLSGHKHAVRVVQGSHRPLTHPRPAPSRPQPWSLCAALPPIGLTAADLFAGGKGSRADLRVRKPDTFTCACCPAARSALDAVPEAYHNPAAVWWGVFASSPSTAPAVRITSLDGRLP